MVNVCRHPKNLAALESDTRFLRHESLYRDVVAIHHLIQASPCLQSKGPSPFSSSLPTLPPILVSGEESLSDPDSPPLSGSRNVSVPWGRKTSSDGSSRTIRRMGSSMKTMFGSVRRLMRSERSEDGATGGAALSGGTAPMGLHSLTKVSNDGSGGGCYTSRF
jgi:hypothetical protein